MFLESWWDYSISNV